MPGTDLCPARSLGLHRFALALCALRAAPGVVHHGTIAVVDKECLVDGCTSTQIKALGLCSPHYRHDLNARAKRCEVDGCERPHLAAGYCTMHYRRWKHHGDVNQVDRARSGVRRYALNEGYFDTVDTPGKAYWLGFITADGGIIRGPRTNALRVELADRDRHHLAALVLALGSTKPVTTTRKGTAAISIDSWRMLDALGRLGVGPRKSATVEPWNGPDDLMRHYWRGLFDGDGSIYRVHARGDWVLNIAGSRACVESFAAWARSCSGATAVARPVRGGCWSFAVTGLRKPQSLAKELYRCAADALDRKRALADELRGVDLDAARAATNAKRGDSLRAAWAEGRHRRKLPPA